MTLVQTGPIGKPSCQKADVCCKIWVTAGTVSKVSGSFRFAFFQPKRLLKTYP